MRRVLAALLAVALVALGGLALAEAPYADYAGEYEFASGAGWWATWLFVNPDGSFYGHFEDSDYMEGTLDGASYEQVLYNCDFTGALSQPEYSDGKRLICRVERLDYEVGDPYVADGIRYEPTESYGLALDDQLCFYSAGAQRSALPEGLTSWLWFLEDDAQIVTFQTLYTETWDAGFSCI